MYELMSDLYPICRSITGDGVRKTLQIIMKQIPLTIKEVGTGKEVFDWTVPKEWNIRDAYIKNPKGERIVDFKNCNLHVLNYSIPVKKNLSLKELKKHLFTVPDYPDWVPYRTSYYNDDWGFCMSHNQLLGLDEGEYEAVIDSTLEDGHLTYGECVIEGEQQEEVLISCHVCHPSLCNDNLSGIVIATYLARYLQDNAPRYSYRFLFIPATIGSITWLALNEHNVSRISHGLVAVNLGDSGKFTYKKSRQGKAEIDQTVRNVLRHCGKDHEIVDFIPYGYDERQYCSPGFNLPIGCLMRTPHGQYPEYHTSADNLDFVSPVNLAESFSIYWSVVNVLEGNKKYLNRNPKCEPQLGKRGLYQKMGGQKDTKAKELAMLWILNLSDGKHSLLDISDASGLKFDSIRNVADLLVMHDLLIECSQ
jgi:aminopeptidase-like protein